MADEPATSPAAEAAAPDPGPPHYVVTDDHGKITALFGVNEPMPPGTTARILPPRPSHLAVDAVWPKVGDYFDGGSVSPGVESTAPPPEQPPPEVPAPRDA